MTNTKDSITILTCIENKRANKKFVAHNDGTIEKISYGAGKFFLHENRAISGFDDLVNVLTELLDQPQKFIIRGVPKPDSRKITMRRIHDPGAAFDPAPHQYVVLDIDKLPCPEYLDPAQRPEEVIKWVAESLPEPFRNVTCFYKFSSSQNIPDRVGERPPARVSVHLAFWLDKPLSESELKRYFKANPCPVDQALFSPVQIHYTANPDFIDMDDPLPHRSGVLRLDYDFVTMPPIPEPEPPKPTTQRPDTPPKTNQDDRDKAIDLLLPYYDEGGRNRMAGALAGALYRGGWAAEDVADFVLMLAETDGDTEAMARHDSAMRICDAIDNNRSAQGIPTLKDEFDIEELDEILMLLGIGKPDIKGRIERLSKDSGPFEIEEVISLLMTLPVCEQQIYLDHIKEQTKQSKQALNKIFNAIKKEYENKGSYDPVVCAIDILLSDHYEDGKLLIRVSDGKFWHYNGKNWEVENGDSIKKKLIPIANDLYDPELATVNCIVNAALNLLKGRVFRRGDPLRLNTDPPSVINCRNGELWFDDKGQHTFRPHKPESYLRNCLNVDYDPTAESPKFDKAVQEIFKKSPDPDDMFRHFMEIIGYLCQPWRKLALILLLHGGGSNGKTSLLKIIQCLLGPKGFMSDRISEIEKNIFKIGALDGKLMLVDDDIDAGTCLADGFLKKISEEKPMTGQHKYGPSFEFTCRAVPVMLSNHYPAVKDTTEGIRRRLMIVPFLHTFKKKEIIPGLFDDIWNEESSGILNHAVAGFQRLKTRGYFDEPTDCLRAKKEWIVRSNVLITFIEERCKQGPEQHQPISEFYQNFREYCEDAGIKKVPTLQGVKNRLESMSYDLTILNGRKVIRGLYAPGWGEKINESDENINLVDEMIKQNTPDIKNWGGTE